MHIIDNLVQHWQKTVDITATTLNAVVCTYLINDDAEILFVVSGQIDKDVALEFQPSIYSTLQEITLVDLAQYETIIRADFVDGYSLIINPLFTQTKQLQGCVCCVVPKSEINNIDFNVLDLAVDSLQNSLASLSATHQNQSVDDVHNVINLQNFINAFSEHIWIKDADGQYIICNRSVESAWNKTANQIVGKFDDDLFDHKTAELFRSSDIDAQVADKPIIVEECEDIDKLNNCRWLETIKAPLRDVNDNLVGTIGITRNIGRNKLAETQLLLAESVFENTIEGVLVTNRDGVITEVNRAFSTITGYSREEAVGQNPRLLNSGKHDTEFFTKMWNTLTVKGKFHGEIWNKRKSGDIFPQLVTINAVYGQDDRINYFVAVFADISNEKQNEQKLENLANYDSLTQLPNRLLLRSHLQKQADKALINQTLLAAIFFDIDFFKHINDSLGHEIGDQLLVEVGVRLSKLSGENCKVARLSSDEFVILLSDVTQYQKLSKRVEHIKAIIEQPFKFGDHPLIRMTISVGVSVFPIDSHNTENIAQNADTALHIAKQSGRNTITFYDSTMTTNSLEHLRIQNALHEAIQEQHFHLVYQPKLSLVTGKLVGLESLIRWDHRDYGFISPADFIPIAEKTGLIHQIGLMVLRMACLQGKEWLDRGHHFGRIAVNVASLQFQRSNFIDNVESILAEVGFPADRLELEMTESCMMYEPEKVIRDLKRLGNMGIQLSVDDFGTGYSSLSYLKKLPINILKIDQSFVTDIPFDNHNTAIAKAIIVLGHALNLKIIAEGVETKEQANFLLENGCDQAQGYYYSKPQLPVDLMKWLCPS
ncbi:putative bifunctional diguanylate cyclase/phosphodiesterase [Shewanella donghaensis]|uniref:putative bifunctional diguanylate cyclase/phosphodiesterase n=1 Tax=Shewanella donghaensis TaxID=238836 RepID=UPI001183423E|nr:EAL domain-containing protein [Shewanella donghaensis]